MIYFVTFDLIESGQHIKDLIEKIKGYDGWAKLGDTCFLVKTEKESAAIRDNLKSVLGSNDKLYVGLTTTPAAWYNLPDEVSDWIKSNL